MLKRDYSKLEKEELINIINKQASELKNKKYGLVWDSEKEPEQVVLDCENNIPILKRVKEKEIKTDDSGDNILIEGDNYHALTCLNYTHKGKIDVIYIDPPYNTGKSNEWKYNDKYVDENDGYRHSKWLNMMEKRLKLASNLLIENGAIFISIDDNEFAQLKLLCDKIFGEKNFIDSVIWNKKSSAKGVPPKNMIVNVHEYILVYQKNGGYKFIGQGRSEESGNFKNPDNDPRGPWRESNIKSTIKPIEDSFTIVDPNTGKEYTNIWAFSKSTLEQMIKEDRILWKDTLPKQKEYMYEMTNENMAIKSNWGVFDPQTTTVFLKELLQNIKFDNPKPINLMEYLIKVSTKKDSIILDFFAGSGTTGHAVLELNKQDEGNRKFILCTNNENKICEEVTYPRIHNVIKGYKFKGKDKTTLFEQKLTFSQLKNLDSIIEEMDKTIEENKTKFDEIEKKFEDNTIKITGIKNIDSFKDGLNGNLQYFKTNLIPVERIDNINDHQRHELTEKAGQMIAIKENTFEEIETNEWYQIFESKDKSRKTAIYFRENMDEFESLVKKIGKTKTVLYVFSYSRIDKKIFNYLDKNIVLEDIPEPILEIYKEINLTFKDK